MPTLSKQTVASAVINNRNIGPDITANIVNGVLFKANQFYNYASKGSYHWGLPNGKASYTSAKAKDNCQAVLEQIEQGPVRINSVIIEPDGTGNYEYTVQYFLLDTSLKIKGDIKTWIYNEGDETYSVLSLSKVDSGSPYYPIIPIRLNGSNLGEDPSYPHTLSIKRGCKFLGIDLDSLYKDINSQQEENGDNPPEDMYILMGASISNNTPRTNEYLFRYFEHMFAESKVKREDYEYWVENQKDDMMSPQNTVTIKDSQFHATLSWDFIDYELVNATGKKGTYLVQYQAGLGRVEHDDWVESTDKVLFSFQVNSTQRLTYMVRGLVFRNLVAGSRWVSKDCRNAFGDPDDPENGEVFIVPLRKDICKEMGAIRSHDLLYEAIRLHVNDVYSYKVKWYQTGFGQIFVLVVAVVISVVFQQWQAGFAIMTAATAGLIVQNVIIALILQPVMTVLVQDVLGDKLALLVAAIVTAYGMSVGTSTTGLTVTTAPTVASVAQASMSLITGLKTLDLEADLAELTEEHEELNQLIDEQAAVEMQSALDTNTVTNMISNDPYNLMGANNYVARSRWEIEKPLLLTATTERYTKVAQFTDLPDSMIRLDVY